MTDRHKCPGVKHHPDHCAARGKVCKSTEDYTDDMARKIHEAWRRSCVSRPAKQGPPIAAKAMPTIAEKQKHEALEGQPCEARGYSSETTAIDSEVDSDCVSDSCSTADETDSEPDYLWTTLDDFQTAMKAEQTYVPKTYKVKNKVIWKSDG